MQEARTTERPSRKGKPAETADNAASHLIMTTRRLHARAVVMTDEELARIQRRISVDDAGCWVWTGSLLTYGYGQVHLRGGPRKVHLLMWWRFRGDIPAGLELDHLCRNRACANPDHLEAVPHIVNVRRGRAVRENRDLPAFVESPRAIPNRLKTHCPHGHEYTYANTYRPPRGHRRRMCRTCLGLAPREGGR